MNPEKLHDALNQLPDDLIAAADALRQARKTKIILWKRLVPMAACFALVLGALYIALPILSPKGSQAAAPEAAPMEMMQDSMSQMEIAGVPENRAEPEAPAEAAPREEPGAAVENDGAPLAPEAEEEAATATGAFGIPVTGYGYCIGAEEPDETQITIISTWKEWETFLTDTPRLTEEGGFENRYDESYFAQKQLIAVVTTAASSSVRYEVDSIEKTGTGTWTLTITQYNPEWFTDDMTQQLILIELPRTVAPEDEITLNLETVTE